MSKSKKSDPPPKPACDTCGVIGQKAFAFEKNGWPEETTHLPAAANNLKTIRVIKDSGSRKFLVQQCPGCGDYFTYELDYEFLAGGSEDEESLIRLTKSEAREILKKRKHRS